MALPPATPKPNPELLPGLPRRPLTPEQQLEALRRVQTQAEQRVQLGMQLFKAAEARVAEQRQALDEVRAEGERLREQLTGDVTKTLQQYDQWIGKIDESFTHAIQELAERMERLEATVAGSEDRLRHMVTHTERMLEQAHQLLRHPPDAAASATRATPPTPMLNPPPKPVAEAPRDAVPPTPAPEAPSADTRIYSQILDRLRGTEPNERAA